MYNIINNIIRNIIYYKIAVTFHVEYAYTNLSS